MTTEIEATAPAVEATPFAELKTRAIPSAFPQEPSESKPAEAPPEAAAETPEAQAAPEDTDDEESGEQPPERAPLPKGVQRKINKLTRKYGEASVTISELQEKLAQYESGQVPQKPTEQPAPVTTPAATEPKIEDFDFDPVAFGRAQYQYLRAQEKQQEQAEARVRTLREKEAAFAEKHPDYEEVTRAPHVPFNAMVVGLMADADDPPAVAYYLGQHVEEATQIAQMTPIAAARAIGRIEAKLSAPVAPAVTREPPKKVTTAPPPPKTVSGAGKPEISVNDPNITTAQRIALWKQQARKS